MGGCQSKDDVVSTADDQKYGNGTWQNRQESPAPRKLSAILEQHDESEYAETNNTDSAAPQARKPRQRMISKMAPRRESLRSKVVNFESKYGSTVDDVYRGLTDGNILGTGIVGTVRKVTHRRTGQDFACKVMDVKAIRGANALLQLRTEIEAMCTLDHSHIVRLEEVYESDREICLILQLCTGGELFDRLDDQPDYRYTEKQAAELVGQMLGAVRYVHSRGIVHRDLKLENFLFVDEEATELRMIDFGLAKYFKTGEDVVSGPAGTPYTMSPEALKGIYSDKCDVWSIGVIAFLCLSGDAPFGGCTEGCSMEELYDNIKKCKFSFEPAYIWGGISETAKDFIRTLLTVDPQKRPSAAEAQKHPWLDTALARDSMDPIGPNVLSSLKAFKDGSQLRRLLSEVVAFTLTAKQIGPLGDEFKKLDPAGTGEISLEALHGVMSSKANTGGLGNLGPSEVTDIFEAMRVDAKKGESRMVHWREFIAAATSMANVDEVNLRLAFDRIDYEHKGHITVENLKEMFGERCMEEYAAAFDAKDGKGALIYYEDFVAMMKMQYFYVPAEQKQAEKQCQAPHGKNRRMSVMLEAPNKKGQFQSSRLMRADVFNTAKAFEIKMSTRDSFHGNIIERPKLMRRKTSAEKPDGEDEEELAALEHQREEMFRLQNLAVAAKKGGRSRFQMSKSTVSEVYYENSSSRHTMCASDFAGLSSTPEEPPAARRSSMT
eukprot:CAMPEP_0194267670 /NCGR_PEP_ID=MMETSP0169-20130528/2145_1 /TAXON_ID=218684 /ORGANISM="Corethron pennatum, Strain L29A3" /LENGTH=718 /DNA_ID=CAMNT_0039008607 /DNA_START=167 /DNA_END=2323 /DNA_ORIENTATION=+